MLGPLPGSSLTATEEADLVQRLKGGEEDAYACLVRLHGGRLLAVSRRFFREEAEAQDAVQEAFLAVFRSMHTFEGQAKLSTWLHRIVVNACLMRLRGQKRRPEESIEPLLPAFDDMGRQAAPIHRWHDIQGEAARKQANRRVRELIAQLPESYRTVLLLRDIEEMDTAQTAQAMGLTENAVKLRLHRARQALRTMLDPEMRRGLA